VGQRVAKLFVRDQLVKEVFNKQCMLRVVGSSELVMQGRDASVERRYEAVQALEKVTSVFLSDETHDTLKKLVNPSKS